MMNSLLFGSIAGKRYSASKSNPQLIREHEPPSLGQSHGPIIRPSLDSDVFIPQSNLGDFQRSDSGKASVVAQRTRDGKKNSEKKEKQISEKEENESKVESRTQRKINNSVKYSDGVGEKLAMVPREVQVKATEGFKGHASGTELDNMNAATKKQLEVTNKILDSHIKKQSPKLSQDEKKDLEQQEKNLKAMYKKKSKRTGPGEHEDFFSMGNPNHRGPGPGSGGVRA